MKKTLQRTKYADVKSVVWIQTSFLGDIVINTAGFDLLKQERPDLKQVLITTDIGKLALKDHPALDHIIVFQKKDKNFAGSFLKVKQDLSILSLDRPILLQAHKSIRSSILAAIIGYPKVTYFETPLSFLAKYRVERVAMLHEAQRQSLLLEPLGISRTKICQAQPHLYPVGQSDLISSQADTINIGVSPGSVWGTKRWPIESYSQLVGRLLENPRHRIYLLGSPDEVEFASHIEERNQSDNLINLAGKTKLDQLPPVYHELDFLIANDSSPIHYASAIGVSTLAIFGSTVSAMGFGPLAHGSTTIERDGRQVPCRPCSDHGPKTCPLGHFRCMREISVPMVLEAFHLLQKKARSI